MTYTIIGTPATRAVRVMWMLELLDQPWDLRAAAPQSDAIRAVNPGGKVPALLDGDVCIIDSVAIITYLADKHGAVTHPAGTPERALQDSFTQFACDELDGSLWTAAKHRFALPEAQRVPEVKRAALWEWNRACATLGKRLGDRTYVTGDTLTVPDIVIGQCAGWARSAKFDWPDGLVGAYFARLQADPALARAREKGAAAMEKT